MRTQGFYYGFQVIVLHVFFRRTAKAKYIFSLLIHDDTCVPTPPLQLNKDIRGIHLLVKAISKITQDKLKVECVHHVIQFLSSSCGAGKNERNKTAAEKCI